MTTMTEPTGTQSATGGPTSSGANAAGIAGAPGSATTSAGPDSAGRAAGAPTEPRHDTALRTIYAGSFSAYVGLAIAEIVYPLLVLGFTGKPLLAGLFGTVQFTALVLASVPAGNFVDRYDRRGILIASETLRAALGAVLAVSLAAGHVSLVEVYLIAAVLGVCQPLSSVRTLALRTIAPKERLVKALSVQQAVSAVAQLIGPALGTLLYSVNRSLPFAAVALGTGISALCAYFVRFENPPRTAKPAEAAASDGTFAGLGFLWRHPVMRSTMIFVMLLNLVSVPLDLVLIVQARREGVPTHFLGLILASFAAGGILGAPFIPRLHALLRPGRLLSGLGVLVTIGCAAVALPLGGFWMAGWLAAIGFVIPAAQVLIDVLILQQVPDHQRGRVLSAVMTFMGLGMPLGAAFGGSLLQVLSPAVVLLGIAGALACVTLYAVAQRDLRHAQWPAAMAA
jgi:MFS family permease